MGEYEIKKQTFSEKVLLYHGSKSGISGGIRPVSREYCDFGKGFYMGTEKTQTLTLVCNFPESKLYTVRADITGLCVLDIEVGIDWALLIAYNRGKLEFAADSSVYKKYSEMASGCDMIIGHIANDRMFVVLDQFFSGAITDVALVRSLSALKLGKQYAALTEKACSRIEIIDEKTLSAAERDELRLENDVMRREGIRLTEEICRRHRREGRFFDEIISGGV